MTSDYFIIPTTPDCYCVTAIESLNKVISSWSGWFDQVKRFLTGNNEVSYPFPQDKSKFLGTIIQNYRPYGGKPAQPFGEWIEKINDKVNDVLYEELDTNMKLSASDYHPQNIEKYCLAEIPDFTSLIPISQREKTPVFELSDGQINRLGTVHENTREQKEEFEKIFRKLGEDIIRLAT